MKPLRTNVIFGDGWTESKKQKHRAAAQLMVEAINSLEFEEYVLLGKFLWMDGKTNRQLLDLIRSGAEKLNPVHDNEIDIKVNLYKAANSTVGYTYPNVVEVWLNDKFFSIYDYAEVAGNMFHEWLHKLGLGHPSAATRERSQTAVYMIGYFVRALVKRLMKGEKLISAFSGEVIDTTPPVSDGIPQHKPRYKTVCKGWWIFKTCRKVAY